MDCYKMHSLVEFFTWLVLWKTQDLNFFPLMSPFFIVHLAFSKFASRLWLLPFLDFDEIFLSQSLSPSHKIFFFPSSDIGMIIITCSVYSDANMYTECTFLLCWKKIVPTIDEARDEKTNRNILIGNSRCDITSLSLSFNAWTPPFLCL